MIRLVSVDLSAGKVKVPVAEIEGDSQGKTLLITAGMDGDEYAGIEAAYRLIGEVERKKFKGKLIIIPIVNIPGFESLTSANPLDNKYPKLIFPGRKNGSPTERLIDWLATNYVYQADVWLDLHGGAIDEILDPYIYIYGTRNKSLNNLTKEIVKSLDAPRIVFARPGSWSKVEILAKKGVVYVITEAGYSGRRKRVFTDKHLRWTKQVMGVLGMMKRSCRPTSKLQIYRKTVRYKIKHEGLWYPFVDKNSFLSKGQKIGEICSLDGKLLQIIKSKVDGELLWVREGLSCKKGEVVVEIGCESVDIANI